MLLGMYDAWASRNRIPFAIVDSSLNSDGNPRSVTVLVRSAYQTLRQEHGGHRLTRVSPYDKSSRRQTSFASVEVLPDLPNQPVELSPKDLRIDTFRAGGKGGQHQQKNDTAVRVTHVPTNLTAKSSTERSQAANRKIALRVLRAKVADHANQKRENQLSKLRLTRSAGFGDQIRSYILPRNQVLDHHTGKKHGNAQTILAGKTAPIGLP